MGEGILKGKNNGIAKQALDDDDNVIGVVVSKLEPHHGGPLRGYIAMLAVEENYRGNGIGGSRTSSCDIGGVSDMYHAWPATKLVRMAIDAMIEGDADEVCFPAGDEYDTPSFDDPHLLPLDRAGDRDHEQGGHEAL